MGSGSSKSSQVVTAKVTEEEPPEKSAEGTTIRETVAFSRKDIVAKGPPQETINVPNTLQFESVDENEYDEPRHPVAKLDTVAEDAELDDDGEDKDRNSLASNAELSLENAEQCGKPSSTMTDQERFARLEEIHRQGTYSETKFSEAKFKVFNDYLTWATETGSRGERVVMPDETMKIEQKRELRETMKKLHEADSYTGNEELHCLLVLCKLSDVRQADYVELVTELGFARLFLQIWDKLHKDDVNDLIENPASYLAINLLLDATQGFTVAGDKLCQQIGELCVPALLAVLHDRFYSVDALNMDSKKLRWMSRREFLKRVLTVLYHCIRHHMDNKSIFRENHATMVLKPYLKCRFLILRVKAIFILAFIVTEDENAHLNTTNTNIDFIVKILSKALNEPNHYSAHYNFSSIQVADAMKYLAANDDNKVKFITAGALSRIVSMMSDENPLEEQRSAIEVLWILSFHPSNQSAILKEEGCLQMVRKCKTHAALSRPCEAILWNVGEETHATLTKKSKDPSRKLKLDAKEGNSAAGGEGNSSSKQSPEHTVEHDNEVGDVFYNDDDDEEEVSTNHVMLSYQWDVQKQILKVKELLQADGYKVWMDVDQMGGSTLEAMASAVENAAVVLICFSEKYKNSPACRTEAEYTFKLNKPIVPLKMQTDYEADGWLGIMLGTKYYIAMATMDEVVDNVDRLKRELANRGRLPSTSISRHLSVTGESNLAVKIRRNDSKRLSKREAVSAKNAANWTNDDVNAWLTRNSLTELKNRLEGYDGEGILGLKTIASDAPEFFYKEVKNELGLKSLREIIRFKQALDDIL
ncbi:uncharacterized protein [Diadema antillarum]|uniref:uncharacterized protein n=1 Tax=Diadema antillarum TaxID=105358 RepID=UPI003A845EF6